jgi:hypothetical protein
MDLRKVHQKLIPAIEEELLFIATDLSSDQVGEVCCRLSEYFQSLAICHLLENADTEQFRENLVRSVYSRRHFLQRCRDEGENSSRYLALSRSDAVLDALVSGRLDLASEVGALSKETWDPRWEYEDDLCFFLFLHLFIRDRSPAGRSSRDEVLTRFERALEGARSNRLEVCRALESGDTDEFASTLNALLDEKKEQSDQERRRIVSDEVPAILFWPRSFVSIESLALLRLAEIAGMPIDNDFPLCPSLGRLPVSDRDYRDVVMEAHRLGLAERK